MGKLFKNKQVVTIFALIVCFVILVVAYRYRVNSAINAISVPVAKMDLEARRIIDESCFETKKVAQSMLSDNVITSASELVGGTETPAKYVNYNTFIPEGSLFYRSQVTTWDQMPDSAWANIEDDHTIISLSVDKDSTYGNSIFPGDVIDLYYQNKYQGKLFIGPLLKNIKVLAVKDGDGQHIFKKSANQKSASELIFSVENKYFLLLKRSYYIGGGKVFPVLRGVIDAPTDRKLEDNTFVTNFINSNSKISTEDTFVETTTPKVTK